MARWFFAIAFTLATVLALAITNEDICSDRTPRNNVALVAAALFIGALTGTLLIGRRPWVVWLLSAVAAGAGFAFVFFVVIVNWVSTCTA